MLNPKLAKLSVHLALLSSVFIPISAKSQTAYTTSIKPNTEIYSLNSLVGNTDDVITMDADKVTNDDPNHIVFASGNVVLKQGKSILKCDKIAYNQETRIITATGNVVLLSANGSVIFSDELEINDSLDKGNGENIKITLADKSRMEAESLDYKKDQKSSLTKASYSPCDLCQGKALWTIHADRIEKDDTKQVYRYYNAWLDFKGVPVLYTPYFSHSDPSAKKKTGFLSPSFGSDSELGLEADFPLFVNISNNQSLTITPRLLSKEGLLLTGKYNALFAKGFLDMVGAVTFTDKDKKTRSYLSSQFEYDINERWRLTGDLNYVSDSTFLKKYDLINTDIPWTQSTLAFERFGTRSYFKAYGMMFQELRSDIDNDFSPKITPAIQYSYMGSPTNKYGYITFDSYAAIVTRNGSSAYNLAEGIQQINTEFGWHLPYTDPLGAVYKINATVKMDGYHVQNYWVDSKNKKWSGNTGRIFPQLSIDWRYPFIRTGESTYQVIEPIASLILSPKGCNPEEIPNEDSLDFTFNETNLFSPNRFAGYDRVESGSRVNYGLLWSLYTKNNSKITALLGQSYRFTEDSIFSSDSGIYYQGSDYVGKIGFSIPSPNIGVNYRFRLARGNFDPMSNEIDMHFGIGWLSFSGYYLNTSKITTEYSILPKRREVGLFARSKLNKDWTLSGYWKYNLIGGGKPIEWGTVLSYEDECFGISGRIKREYTKDNDYRGGTSFLLQLNFKTLGMVNAGRK